SSSVLFVYCLTGGYKGAVCSGTTHCESTITGRRMKSLLLLLLVAVTVSSVVSKPLPEDSEAESYPSTEEEAKRKEMWLATRKRVMEHNMRAGNGLESYTMAVNHFADLTTEEVPKGLLPMTYNSTKEEAKRKEIWLATRRRVMEHNKRAENGSESFTTGMNYFSDMTFEEVPRGGLMVVSKPRDGEEEAEVDKEFETWKVQHGKSYGSTEEEAKPGEDESELDKEFEAWKIKHGKSYESPEEEAKRREIWLATRTRVMEHNKRAETGLESYTMGMNHLSDRTTEEVTGRRPQDGEEAEVHKEFETWKVQYGKTYPSTEEEAKRKEIWLATRKIVMEHNKRAENGLESYTLAVNHFADLTNDEVPRGLLPMVSREAGTDEMKLLSLRASFTAGENHDGGIEEV
ncbi:unnamed protein product, partial [Coregonus sp. 'balchen']